MKVGVEDRRKVSAACALSAVALLMLGHWISLPESSASANSVSSAPTTRAFAASTGKIKTNKVDSLDPTLRISQLELTEHQEYQGSGRNIFQSYREDQTEEIAPKPAPTPQPPTPSVKPAEPTTRLKFFGVATMASLPRKVCLWQDGDIFIAAEGDIVAGRYEIRRIGPDTVDIKDLLQNREHTLSHQP